MIPAKLAPLALLGYVLLRGCDASVLKWLQERASATLVRTAGGEDPISFANVFFYANLATGLVVLLLDRGCLKRQLPQLALRDRSFLCLRAVLGSLIGPICYFLALQRLTVISQTLLFTLILPITALLAQLVLREPLPKRFGFSVALLPLGLLISRHIDLSSTSGAPWSGLDPVGLALGLLSVVAFSAAGVLNRAVVDKGWGVGLAIGLTNLLAALIFGTITLAFYGPEQFLYMRWWWLFGLLLIYTACINLGGELLLLMSYRGLGAVTVALWGNAGIFVSLVSAYLLLGESLSIQTLMGALLILLALVMAGTKSVVNPEAA
ncbi:DMT family transporter [Vulcanococcus sp. Clear-D1]|uniref:DMT family transporter n=1 Tax=Vulcanococcus sp. Clear-D1 TaxID=2766970 RepID=UPI0019ADB058|nr:DMT family transporter [Vulcanococcus sp. Clear-D1]MBD1194246.1 DMT family transporter [Vulcanococcus sp. Clear-D1]